MAYISGVVRLNIETDKYPDGLLKYISPIHVENFNMTLSKDLVYMIGIDQSTTCTGIFITDTKCMLKIILELKRMGEDKEIFYKDLQGILGLLFSDVKVSLIVHEDPVPNKNKYYSGAILLELAGRIKTFMGNIPSLARAEIAHLPPQSWKPFAINKELAKESGTTSRERGNNKETLSYDICQKFCPEFMEYRARSFSSGFDGFDACGILYGFLLASHDENGNRIIYGRIEKRHKSLVCYDYITKYELKNNQEVFSSRLGLSQYSVKPTFLFYNNRYNLFKNIRMASSNWNSSVTLLPKKELERLRLQFDFEEDNNKVLVMYVFKQSAYTQSQLDYIKSRFPWNEIITGGV